MLLDIHTHRALGEHVVRNVMPSEWHNFVAMHPTQRVSVGIHPWYIDEATLSDELALLAQVAVLPQVYAIGEVGLDRRCTTLFDLQMRVLREHIRISEQVCKPLILHCVGAYNELLLLKREEHPTQQWIVHGFRAKPQLAQSLLNEGFALSFGYRFNAESLRLVPRELLYIETDDAPYTIDEVRNRVDAALSGADGEVC